MDKIVDNLYLGDWNDGQNALKTGKAVATLCVIESHPSIRYLGMTYYVPILRHDTESYLSSYPPVARVRALDVCSKLITRHMSEGVPLLVHCWAGQERSPLTIAYWLIKSRQFNNFDEAYTFLKERRPMVEDRRVWMPKDWY